MPTSEIAVQSNIWETNSVLQEKRDNTKSQGYMPFLFKSKRQFPNDKHQIPPVGAYNVPGVFDKLTLSAVANQPQILKQQFQRKNQMCIFKSNQNDIPGPASYNYMNNHSSTKFKPLNYKIESSKQKLQLIKKLPTCPAIPDSKVRYGYTKDPTGNFKLIEKTQTQVLKEKQKLKEYFSTLVGQNHYSRISRVKQSEPASKNNLNPHQIITKLEKYVENRNSQINSSSKNSRDKKSVKPKIKLSHDIQPVKKSNDHLGPGCYNVSLDTVKKGRQSENFQFFSSSEIRFASLKKEQDVNPYEHIFIEKKNMKAGPNLPGKIYKKSFPTYLDPNCFEKIQNPGPGYYEPEVEKVKKSNGNVRFGYESRFKQRQEFTNESTHQEVQNNEESVKWGNLRKKMIQSPHKQYEPVKESEIYGIMNEQVSDSKIHGKNLKMKSITKKQSAVFLDKSQRLNICQKTYYKGENDLEAKEETKKLWDTKGSFMSKLAKKSEVMKENTPGPGAYGGEKLRKKTFNIKNY